MRKGRTNLELRTIKRNDGQLEWLPVPSWKEEEGEPIDGTPAPAEEGGTSSGTPFNYEAQNGVIVTCRSEEEQYGVIVTCRSEEEQMEVYNRLTGEGYVCIVVSV